MRIWRYTVPCVRNDNPETLSQMKEFSISGKYLHCKRTPVQVNATKRNCSDSGRTGIKINANRRQLLEITDAAMFVIAGVKNMLVSS